MLKINKKLICALMAATFCFSINFSPVNKSYAKEMEKTNVAVSSKIQSKENINFFYTNTIKFTATSSSGKALDSGVWIVKDKNNKVYATFNVSNHSNVFTKTLPNGEFQFEQKTAPNGYIKDNKILTIKTPIPVKNKGDVFEIFPKTTKKITENTQKTPEESTEIYKTGSPHYIYFLSALALIFPIVFLVVNSNKKKVGEK